VRQVEEKGVKVTKLYRSWSLALQTARVGVVCGQRKQLFRNHTFVPLFQTTRLGYASSHKEQNPTPSSSSSSAINIEVTERSESKDETPLSNQVERPEGLDKENVKKSAFQPPSPLTSRRSKQKLSTSKKVLSPNRNNQWTRDRESTNTSRQPRSSPIHGRQSFSQVSYHIGAMFLGAPFSLAFRAERAPALQSLFC
jgi:hypothetical protein